MKVIEIVVLPDGQAQLQTRGFEGPTCREASRFVEEALGKCLSDRHTAEFHQSARNQNRTTQRQ